MQAAGRNTPFELGHPPEPGHIEVRGNICQRIQNEVSLHYTGVRHGEPRLADALAAEHEQVYAKLDIQPPKPDLVVYLQVPVDVLLERISKRGIDYEKSIERHYLERLNEAYARFFHEFKEAPLLIVNAAAIDPINNQADYDELLAAIQRMRRGRLYYNPLRSRSL